VNKEDRQYLAVPYAEREAAKALGAKMGKAALIFVPEPEDEGHQAVTYQELWARVNEVAAMLRDFAGLKTGDRVTLHLPMVPELPITNYAGMCPARRHSFGGVRGI